MMDWTDGVSADRRTHELTYRTISSQREFQQNFPSPKRTVWAKYVERWGYWTRTPTWLVSTGELREGAFDEGRI